MKQNMKQKIFVMTLALMLSATGWAQGVSGISYTQLDEDELSVGALVGSVGYRYAINDTITLIPELRVGLGVKDDTFEGGTVKLNGFVAGAVRAQFQISEPIYLFTAGSYGRYRVKASVPGADSVSDASKDWGFGGGIGLNINQTSSIEIGYEDIGGLDSYTIGARFNF